MADKLPKYLYRSIKLEYLNMYMADPDQIPFLEGKYFKQFNHLNPFNYEDEERYLHFFDEREMAKGYALDSSTNGKFKAPHIVCVFQFPEEILRACRTDGKFGFYTSNGGERFETHNEYIIPADFYDPAQNFVGVLERNPMAAPNVYAVVRDDDVDAFATDLSLVGGREYLGQYSGLDGYTLSLLKKNEIFHGSKNLKRLLSGFEGDTRAIEMFSKKEDANASLNSHFEYNPKAGWSPMRVMDVMPGVNALYASTRTVVPFYVAPEILDQYNLGKTSRGGTEYLVPIDCLTEENYFETGNDWINNPQNAKPKKKDE